MSPEQLFTRFTDWELLKQQKLTLLNISQQYSYPYSNDPLTKDAIDHLEGLISFIDAIQDLAVDYYGMEKSTVFNLTKEEENGE